MENKTNTFRIYRDGNLDMIATYSPVVRQKLHEIGNKIDFFFINRRWPNKGEL